MAEARSIEHEIKECESDYADLCERRDRGEQTWREREGMLRFAAGELRFERDRGSTNPDLAFQINELESRLAEVMAEHKAHERRLDDEGVELAMRWSEIEAKRPEIRARLAMLVDETAPRFADNTTLTPHIAKYSRLREID